MGEEYIRQSEWAQQPAFHYGLDITQTNRKPTGEVMFKIFRTFFT